MLPIYQCIILLKALTLRVMLSSSDEFKNAYELDKRIRAAIRGVINYLKKFEAARAKP